VPSVVDDAGGATGVVGVGCGGVGDAFQPIRAAAVCVRRQFAGGDPGGVGGLGARQRAAAVWSSVSAAGERWIGAWAAIMAAGQTGRPAETEATIAGLWGA
jgi:hypothetical protein